MNNYPAFSACNLLFNYQLYIITHLAILEYIISPTLVMINNKYLCDIYIGIKPAQKNSSFHKDIKSSRLYQMCVLNKRHFLKSYFYLMILKPCKKSIAM